MIFEKTSLSVQNHLASVVSNTVTISKQPKSTFCKELPLREHPINTEIIELDVENALVIDEDDNSEKEASQKINNFLEMISEKIQTLSERLDSIENRISQIKSKEDDFAKQDSKNNEGFVKLTTKEFENILSRISILETEILISKQVTFLSYKS